MYCWILGEYSAGRNLYELVELVLRHENKDAPEMLKLVLTKHITTYLTKDRITCYLQELTRNNERIFRTVQQDLRDILNSPYIKAGEVEQVSRSFEQIMDTAIDDLDFVNQILSNDFLKMTDAERTAILMEKKVQSQEMVAELEVKTRRYREIISFRRMQDIINNREEKY